MRQAPLQPDDVVMWFARCEARIGGDGWRWMQWSAESSRCVSVLSEEEQPPERAESSRNVTAARRFGRRPYRGSRIGTEELAKPSR